MTASATTIDGDPCLLAAPGPVFRGPNLHFTTCSVDSGLTEIFVWDTSLHALYVNIEDGEDIDLSLHSGSLTTKNLALPPKSSVVAALTAYYLGQKLIMFVDPTDHNYSETATLIPGMYVELGYFSVLGPPPSIQVGYNSTTRVADEKFSAASTVDRYLKGPLTSLSGHVAACVEELDYHTKATFGINVGGMINHCYKTAKLGWSIAKATGADAAVKSLLGDLAKALVGDAETHP